MQIDKKQLDWSTDYAAKLESSTKVNGKDSAGHMFFEFTTAAKPEEVNCTFDKSTGKKF